VGFINIARGLRAIGYVEPDPLPRGPIALVTRSGSVFSALLRTRRKLGFTRANNAVPEPLPQRRAGIAGTGSGVGAVTALFPAPTPQTVWPRRQIR
jgi:hypothetical protein